MKLKDITTQCSIRCQETVSETNYSYLQWLCVCRVHLLSTEDRLKDKKEQTEHSQTMNHQHGIRLHFPPFM